MPNKVVLISCVATKRDKPLPAQELYNSDLFHKTLNYGKSLNPDKMYILSAKHYLLPLQKVIKPYDVTLNNMAADEKKEWANKVLDIMKYKKINLEEDEFIILAGATYSKYLLPELKNVKLPLKGLRIGQQKSFLKKKLEQLKKAINELKNRFYEIVKRKRRELI